MICPYCEQEMTDRVKTKSCNQDTVKYPDGSEERAIAHQDDEGRRCPDCGVATGGWHHPGCDRERCPKCWGQVIACPCFREPEEA